jgi:lipopolysaccharide/colanic/teichoic acid biosynthesis glycosyltransferase
VGVNGNGHGHGHGNGRHGTNWPGRALEMLGATAALVLSLPLLAVGAAAVALESGRPVFFGQTRLGKDGKPFRCWKLRTMTTDAEARLSQDSVLRERYRENGFKIPTEEDPRVTPVGRRLRLRYLDELPQLINVLNGTMSLVGPRPIVPDELEHYGSDAAELLSVKPGVFGAWTARGRDRPDYPERVGVELEYVRRQSVAAKLAILARSVPVVLRGQGGA